MEHKLLIEYLHAYHKAINVSKHVLAPRSRFKNSLNPIAEESRVRTLLEVQTSSLHEVDQELVATPQNTVFLFPNRAQTVLLAGSWDNWSSHIPLEPTRTAHCLKLQLTPGFYEYKFIADGVWTTNPHSAVTMDGKNNVLTVHNAATKAPLVVATVPWDTTGDGELPIDLMALYVTGSFCEWKQLWPLQRDNCTCADTNAPPHADFNSCAPSIIGCRCLSQHTRYSTSLRLPRGVHEIKFVVDTRRGREWRMSRSLASVETGERNNIISV
eukprot:JP446586.1.p1 GENE.JP446586.1~~JP446586.1.p1  ORF type:complete len:270 (+),score=38.56 JP446586.1:101-910(+)